MISKIFVKKPRWARGILIGSLLGGLVAAWALAPASIPGVEAIRRLEDLTYDFRVTTGPSRRPDSRVVIVTRPAATLTAGGRRHFRTLLPGALDNLKRLGVQAIGVDFTLEESGLAGEAVDQALARSLADERVVLAGYVSGSESLSLSMTGSDRLAFGGAQGKLTLNRPHRAFRYQTPFLGMINLPIAGGSSRIIRHVQLYQSFPPQDGRDPVLPLERKLAQPNPGLAFQTFLVGRSRQALDAAVLQSGSPALAAVRRDLEPLPVGSPAMGPEAIARFEAAFRRLRERTHSARVFPDPVLESLLARTQATLILSRMGFDTSLVVKWIDAIAPSLTDNLVPTPPCRSPILTDPAIDAPRDLLLDLPGSRTDVLSPFPTLGLDLLSDPARFHAAFDDPRVPGDGHIYQAPLLHKGTHQVTILVEDAAGQPVEGVRVLAYRLPDGHGGSGMTDPAGRVTLESLDADTYSWLALKESAAGCRRRAGFGMSVGDGTGNFRIRLSDGKVSATPNDSLTWDRPSASRPSLADDRRGSRACVTIVNQNPTDAGSPPSRLRALSLTTGRVEETSADDSGVFSPTWNSTEDEVLILEGEGGWAVVLPELDPYRDAVVLMGSLLVADMDFFVTPMDLAGRSMTFGVEIHGWALENLLGNRGVREFSLARPGGSEPAMKGKRVHPARGGPWNVPWGVWIPLVLGALLGLILATFRLGLALAGCAALMVVHGATAHSLLVTHSIWIDLVIPWITAALVLFDGLLQYYRHSYQEANQVRAIFARFVNPDVVRQIIETGMDDLDVLGTNRRITIMFSDIRGFTSISETLSPEAVMGMLNEYFSVMGPIMKKHGGVIDKYIGDAIMGFFGAPIPTTTHPVDAVRAALEMIEANEAIRNSRKDWFRIGFGINTGECLTGVLGERGGHVNYSAIGDAVNLASRLEGLNKEFKTRLLISESTYQEVRDFFETHAVGDVMVKGKAQPVRVFEVLRERTLRSPDRITRTMPVPPIALD